VKAFVKNIEREREKSCDEIVMQFQYEPHGYASALLQLEKANYLPQTLTVAAGGKKKDLLHRVEWIMGIRQRTVSFSQVAGVLAALFCFIALNALLILGTKTKGDRSNPLFSNISSPLYFFEEGTATPTSPLLLASTEKEKIPVVNHLDHAGNAVAEGNTQCLKNEASEPDQVLAIRPPAAPMVNGSPFSFASIMNNVIPALEAQKEAHISIALEATKKVITEGQWKEMEKGIADALTSIEKDKLKTVYTEAMNNVDLSTVYANLRLAYDNIDWNGINTELNNALAEIKIDSLQKVYSVAIANLSELQEEMKENKVSGIPDTDITLKSIEDKKKEATQNVIKLKILRNKKIVRL
jgi:hypothetical protein